MLDWISQLLLPNENPTAIQSLIVMILTIGLGVFLGNLKIKNTSLGVSAVMFAGLFLGHYGYRMDASISNFIRDLGLIFFVYAIGLQLGPSFFSAFKAQGLKYNILAASGILLSTSLAFIIFLNTDLGIENTVGILSGSVTSTPALGAAKNMIDELRPQFPDRHLNSPAIGYAITYPMGVLGVIFSIITARVLLKIDPQKELVKFRERIIHRSQPIIPKKCRITNPHFVGKTIREAIKEIDKNIIVTHLKRSGTKEVITPESSVILNDRDVLMIVGTEPDVDFFISQIGRISSDSFIEGGDSGKTFACSILWRQNPRCRKRRIYPKGKRTDRRLGKSPAKTRFLVFIWGNSFRDFNRFYTYFCPIYAVADKARFCCRASIGSPYHQPLWKN